MIHFGCFEVNNLMLLRYASLLIPLLSLLVVMDLPPVSWPRSPYFPSLESWSRNLDSPEP